MGMIALAPSIEAAVQAALLNLRQQQSSVSSSSFSAGNQQNSASFSAGSSQQTSGSFSAGSQQSSGFSVSATQQVSAAEEQALVLRIIEVLTPTITTSVRRALASRVQSVQTVQVQAPAAVSQQNFAANQQSSLDPAASHP